MELTFLGSGGAFTDYRVNYHTAFLLPDVDGNILVDCGGATVQSCKELSICPGTIKCVLITHLHGDHISGLEQLVWERLYAPPLSSPTKGPQWQRTRIVTANTISSSLRDYLSITMSEHTARDGSIVRGVDSLVDVDGVQPGVPIQIGCYSVIFKDVPHVIADDGYRKPCYGMEITNTTTSKSIFFTGDSTFNLDNINHHIDRCSLIIHDCTFGAKYRGTVHTHYREDLCTLPRSVRSKIALSHFTSVPASIDVIADGFYGAIHRHQVIKL